MSNLDALIHAGAQLREEERIEKGIQELRNSGHIISISGTEYVIMPNNFRRTFTPTIIRETRLDKYHEYFDKDK